MLSYFPVIFNSNLGMNFIKNGINLMKNKYELNKKIGMSNSKYYVRNNTIKYKLT